jgi:hypothetical protein
MLNNCLANQLKGLAKESALALDCNPSYFEDRDLDDLTLRPLWVKARPYLNQ